MSGNARFSVGCSSLLGLWLPQSGLTCPLCDSPTGDQVRAAIFNDGFLTQAAAIAAPFPILLAIVAWIYFGGRGASGGKRANQQVVPKTQSL